MNKSFRDVAAKMRGPLPVLTHKEKVCRLYRKSLKLLSSWTIDRELWNSEATKIRAQFNAHQNLPQESGLVKRLIREMEEKHEFYTHPDPYVIPWMPGGTLFMRNPPIPLNICYPEGIPEGTPVSPVEAVNIDMTPLPAKKHVLVDFSKKTCN